MRHVALMVALLTMTGMTAISLRAAELDIPPRRPSENVSIQKGPPNCSRWTDECVNCTRGTDGESPVCSNIGFACQPKAIRCIGSEPSGK
jgi:hypothetical protein